MTASLPLTGQRVVEVSAFVAAPFAGLTLAQAGAEVVRVDPLGGGLDAFRWPVNRDGISLYWLSLNRGKRSFAADVTDAGVRALVVSLITDDPAGGVLLTNVSPSWLDFERLRERRPDVIVVEIQGSPDGSVAVDYTVNPAIGFPLATGTGDQPVNHVLPAWDLIAGSQAALAVVAAVHRRNTTGIGAHVRIALSDVALGATAALGFLAEAEVNDVDRAADGNYLYGSYGKDFVTNDGHRVMVVAVTPRHWDALVAATGTGDAMTALERAHQADFHREGDRFLARAEITEVLEGWFAMRSLAEVTAALDGARACWSAYRSFRQVAGFAATPAADLAVQLTEPGVGTMTAVGSPLRWERPVPLEPTHRLGADTEQILSGVLGIPAAELAALRARGVL